VAGRVPTALEFGAPVQNFGSDAHSVTGVTWVKDDAFDTGRSWRDRTSAD
jgi:hypothetical protein